MTLPIQDFVDNSSPVGGGNGPALNAGFFNAIVDNLGDTNTRLTALEDTPPGGGAVDSVNAQTGVVVLDHADVGATKVLVDGAYVTQLDVGSTPVTAGDVGAYTTAQTDSAIATATAAFAPVVALTQAAYDALTPVAGTLYIVTG